MLVISLFFHLLFAALVSEISAHIASDAIACKFFEKYFSESAISARLAEQG
jgi:hypothetical protein